LLFFQNEVHFFCTRFLSSKRWAVVFQYRTFFAGKLVLFDVSKMKLVNLPFKLDLAESLSVLEKTGKLTFVNLANAAAKSFLIADVLQKTPFRNVAWASTDEQADSLAAAAGQFFDGEIFVIPAQVSPRQLYSIHRSLARERPTLLLFEDFEKIQAQEFPSPADLSEATVVLNLGEKIKIFEVFLALEKNGYRPAEDRLIQPGEFVRRGENLFIFPTNGDACVRAELFGDEIEKLHLIDQTSGSVIASEKKVAIFPQKFPAGATGFFETFPKKGAETLFISDDLDAEIEPRTKMPKIKFTSFPREDETFFHLNFFSVLPFYTIADFVVDIKERFRREFEIVIATKKFAEIEKIFRENEIMFTEDLSETAPSTVKIVQLEQKDFTPHSFQNNERKIVFLTDREIFQFYRTSRQKKAISGVNFELMNALKSGDAVVHSDHGLAIFEGIVRRDLGADFGTREYLKLGYAENDKLFVPVESAEKITKFIGDEHPKLTRLGANEWKRSQEKLKVEAEKIAKDLLKLYAARELAKGKKFIDHDEMLDDFCAGFQYELTPGQANAWLDVSRDMESVQPMDRLVCGDVGFGKTEIAMRAAFKAFRSGMQAAILAPITILAEQHFQSFKKRVADKSYGVRVELLSRFQSAAEQKKILRGMELGTVDIVIGTHRILSEDIKFKNIGLLVVDEEQRFGVKQKEQLKKIRTGVDVLTMTATPIPRTLNFALNKLKDISTITTPPPGRLPIVTEVRKYNLNLIRERILFELERGGQVYFLHNEVRTIEGQAQQLRTLLPEAKILVAHGQLKPEDLEQRVRAFKNGEADVLVASTIIENGIDLPRANTLLVNRAEKFGLSQLYQLRGRVGRSRTQAYSYFLYHGQKLALESKKRLRAIVEASELGSGFQIAMRDLEIRGAGEVLGVNQAGAIKNVGVSHFMRMLAKTVDEMKSGEVSSDLVEEENITVEIPLSAYIPAEFIPNENEKIQVYQELAAAENFENLEDLKHELRQDYGHFPQPVENLCHVIALKLFLRDANLEGVKIHRLSHKSYEVVLRMGKNFDAAQVFNLVQKSTRQWTVTANALKLKLEKLSVNWYEHLVAEVQLLRAEKKVSKK